MRWWKRKKKEKEVKVVGNKRTIPFSMAKGVPIITCTLNGRGARLLIDTGASLNVLEKSYSKHYKFTVWRQKGGEVSGIGGASSMLGVSKVSLVIDRVETPLPFKAISFNGVQKKLGVVGVIGSKFFKDKNAVICYESKTITWEE